MDQTYGTLFFEIAKILQKHRPKAFLLENVKGLVHHDGGKTMATILGVLENDLGYHVTWRVIDSSPWVPQRRKRIYIAGFRDLTGFSFDGIEVPPEPWPKLGSILHPEDGTEPAEPPYTLDDGAVNPKYTLSDVAWAGANKHKFAKATRGFGYELYGPDDVARTLISSYWVEILIRQKGKNPRRLTPRECARLMGFDGPGKKRFEIPVSDSRAYQQFGNAVVPPLIEAIAREMVKHLA